jgi:putative ABC transport system substrate-binding protein
MNAINTTSRSFKFRAALGLIALSLILSSCGVESQRVYRVGILSGLSAFAPAVDGFKAKMTELGYIEGENITYDVQSTEVDMDAYTRISEQFVADGVDLIFVFPTEASMAAKAATQASGIPVVFTLTFTDVEGIDLIDTVREPGGNVSGVRFPSVDIASKRLEILLQIVPDAKRIFVPYLQGYPNVPGQLDAIHPQAESLGVELVEFAASSPDALQAEVDRLSAESGSGIDAVLMIAEPLAITPPFYTILGKYCYENNIPIGVALMNLDGYETIFGLLPDPANAGEAAALTADKILRGAVAGTIPVQTSESYFQINYLAAQHFGVTVPDGLLKQADEIIK